RTWTAACWVCAKVELQNTLTHAGSRNRRAKRGQDRRLTGIGAPFVTVEEEYLVLHDRTTDSASKCVTNQRRTRNSVVVVEPVVGGENCVAVGFEGCAMPGV